MLDFEQLNPLWKCEGGPFQFSGLSDKDTSGFGPPESDLVVVHVLVSFDLVLVDPG